MVFSSKAVYSAHNCWILRRVMLFRSDKLCRPGWMTMHICTVERCPRLFAGRRGEMWSKLWNRSLVLAECHQGAHLITVGLVTLHLIFDFVAGVHNRRVVLLAELARDLGQGALG